MKKVIKLSEEKLSKIVSNILEQVQNFEGYDNEDFFEVFLNTFRPWVAEKLGEDVKRYPLSYLIKKYGNDFEKDMGVDTLRGSNSDTYNAQWRIKLTAKELIKKGLYTLPSLGSDVKFTEKYKKVLSHFFENRQLPDYVTISLVEDQPNKVSMKTDVDFQKMVMSDEFRRINTSNILHDLKTFLSDFANVEFGNPVYGQVSLTPDNINYIGIDEWIKKVLNKKLKKEIKETIPNAARGIHSIRFEVFSGKAQMKIVYKDSVGWNTRSGITNNIRQYLTNLGYNSKALEVVD